MSRRRPRALASTAAAFLAAALAVAGCGGGGDAAQTESKRTPAPSASKSVEEEESPPRVLDRNFPDPDLLKVGNTYYAYATQPTDNSANISMATATNLTEWEVASKDPLPKLGTWATPGYTWAPEVTAVEDSYVMYYTARSTDKNLQCIGVARASNPEGPFEPVGSEPLICPEDLGGAIDAASFVDTDGKRYILWKNDGNCCSLDTWIYLQPASPDGLRVAGSAKRLIKQSEAWEGNLVEAPTLVRHDSTYFLFYSANDYGGEDYATGYATAPKITGPYDKADQPLLTTNEIDVIGPGGQDIVKQDGKTYIVFHGWDEPLVARGMYVAELTWKDGRPVVEP